MPAKTAKTVFLNHPKNHLRVCLLFAAERWGAFLVNLHHSRTHPVVIHARLEHRKRLRVLVVLKLRPTVVDEENHWSPVSLWSRDIYRIRSRKKYNIYIYIVCRLEPWWCIYIYREIYYIHVYILIYIYIHTYNVHILLILSSIISWGRKKIVQTVQLESVISEVSRLWYHHTVAPSEFFFDRGPGVLWYGLGKMLEMFQRWIATNRATQNHVISKIVCVKASFWL